MRFFGEGVAEHCVEGEGKELAGDDHQLVLRDDAAALGCRRHFGEVYRDNHGRATHCQAQQGPGHDEQFSAWRERARDGGHHEDQGQPHDGLSPAETVREPSGADGAESSTKQERGGHKPFSQRRQAKVALHERQGAVDDPGVVAEQQAAEGGEQRHLPHELLRVARFEGLGGQPGARDDGRDAGGLCQGSRAFFDPGHH